MALDPEETLAALVVRRPLAGPVLARYGIDYATRGSRGLAAACAEAGRDPERLLSEIRLVEAREPSPIRWDQRPLAELVAELLREHATLRYDLDRADELAAALPRGDDRLAALAAALHALAEELTTHMLKEERVLFPWIRAGRGATAAAPIHAMCAEHADTMAELAELRALTDGFRPRQPEEVALVAALARLDETLKRHIHLENHVLFPRALAG